MLSFYCITTCVSNSPCNFPLLASVAVWRTWVTCKSIYKSATWSKVACDKSWHKSTYKLCGDGDHHEEIHTISHYNCFTCVIVMSLFLPLLANVPVRCNGRRKFYVVKAYKVI